MKSGVPCNSAAISPAASCIKKKENTDFFQIGNGKHHLSRKCQVRKRISTQRNFAYKKWMLAKAKVVLFYATLLEIIWIFTFRVSGPFLNIFLSFQIVNCMPFWLF